MKKTVYNNRTGNNDVIEIPIGKYVCIGVLTLFTIIALLWAGTAGCASYNRYQKRAEANNKVKVTHILIRNAQQQADVVHAQNARVQALADQRIIAANGLAKAQKIIHSTLTPLYVQFEAIEAQKAIATSGKNNTVIYVPSGTNGTPVITQDSQDSLTNHPQTTP